jgi:predicted nuclease with TOPRIM domain
MTEEELRTKIEELEKQRQELIEKLYPRAPEVPEVEARKLRLELTLIDGQVHALTEVLAEKLTGVEPASHSEGEESEKAKGDQLDPAVELARSRRYFHSNMSLFGTE